MLLTLICHSELSLSTQALNFECIARTAAAAAAAHVQCSITLNTGRCSSMNNKPYLVT